MFGCPGMGVILLAPFLFLPDFVLDFENDEDDGEDDGEDDVDKGGRSVAGDGDGDDGDDAEGDGGDERSVGRTREMDQSEEGRELETKRGNAWSFSSARFG